MNKQIGILACLCAAGLAVAQEVRGGLIYPKAVQEASFPAVGDAGAIIFGLDAGIEYISDGTQWNPRPRNIEREIGSAYSNVAAVAGVTIGGIVLPFDTRRVTFTSAATRLSVQGAGGTSAANLVRISDGTSNCDCVLSACNASTGNKNLACSGGCVYDGGASLTYTINSIGNCVTGPTMLGVINLYGKQN